MIKKVNIQMKIIQVRIRDEKLIYELINESMIHCQNKITLGFVMNQLVMSDILLICVNKTKRAGFLLATRYKNKLKIDVICSSFPGGGKRLMKKIEQIALKAGCSIITTDALPAVEGYYKKQGYSETTMPCKKSPKVLRSGSKIHGFRYSKCIS
jgi:hypothetical protein